MLLLTGFGGGDDHHCAEPGHAVADGLWWGRRSPLRAATREHPSGAARARERCCAAAHQLDSLTLETKDIADLRSALIAVIKTVTALKAEKYFGATCYYYYYCYYYCEAP